MSFPRKSLAAAVAFALSAPLAAHATNGYFSHGYGMRAKGMGGAATALSQDAFAGANNPAASAFAGERVDLGIDWFSPKRKVTRTGSGGGMLDFSVDSDSTNFFIPEFGYNAKPMGNLAWGITVYGNGGMNTDFAGGQLNCAPMGGPSSANGLCGVGRLGVDLTQLIVAPSIAYRVAPDHAIGVAPLFAYQRFELNGAHLFTSLSQSAGDVTNRGYDSATGWGVRVGYQGRVAPGVTVGAAYTTKTRMGEFDKYKGIFADRGDFDIPAHVALGVAFEPVKNVQVAVDWERIKYSGVGAVGNPSTNQAPLGAAGGPGFGWQDIDVWKVGVQWKASDALTLRAGYNRSDNPIQARDVTFNILAPGVIKDHLTLGCTYALDRSSDITVAYMHAFSNSVQGPSFFNAFAPGMGGNEKIEMYQNSLGIAWAKRW